MARKRRRFDLSKFFFPLLAGGIVALCELCSFAVLSIQRGAPYLPRDSQAIRRKVQEPRLRSTGKSGISKEVIHPYMGFVYNPEANSPKMTAHHDGFQISDYGFLDDKSPIQRRGPDRVVLGITGGSFAAKFAANGAASLVRTLSKAPGFKGKEFIVVRLGLGGVKQPQQLMTIAYLLAQGAEFDLIVNIDGFNEVAIPPTENLPMGVSPIFPRGWALRVGAIPERSFMLTVGRMVYLEERRASLAKTHSRFPLRYSMSANLLWHLRDRPLVLELESARKEAIAAAARPSYQRSGPTLKAKKGLRLYQELEAIWRRSSLTLKRLCDAHDIEYFHFLQPNQYVKGSKTFTPAERRIAVSKRQPYRIGVELGYPLLREGGRKLAAAGVNFHDLTDVFRNTTKQVYVDSCCHISKEANSELGTILGARILKNYTRKSIGR